jgi:DNA-binding transcriptional ArsR family regulator
MGNAARLRIDIVAATNLAQAKVSQHLAILRAYGIVATQREGKDVIYRIANPKLTRVCDLMREVLAEQASERSEVFHALEEEE